MGFLSVLKKIGHGITVGTTAVAPFEPYLAAVPGFGPVFDLAFHGIQLAEQLVPGPNGGPTKKSLVLGMVNAVHPGLDQKALGASIDELVGALNRLTTASAAPVLAGAPPVTK